MNIWVNESAEPELRKQIAELEEELRFFKATRKEGIAEVGAQAIRDMLTETGHGLNPDWLKHFNDYADKLEQE